MSRVVLLTGATGFLGTQVARRFLAETDGLIFALVRAENSKAALQSASRAWWDWPELIEELGGRIHVIRGDITEPRLGLAEAEYDDLVHRVTHIVHTAADLRLEGPLDELRRTNVEGTANVLALARAIDQDHGLTRLSHVSTAYVAGRRRGRVPEDSLTDTYGFANGYERTKYEGERLVRAARADLPISVFRPGMVVGDTRAGAVKTFNTLYFPLRLYLSGRLRVLPVSRRLRVNLIPVDYVAEAIVRLTLAPRAAGRTFHLTAPSQSLPTTGELVRFTRAWAREQLGVTLPRPLFLPMPLVLGRFRPAATRYRDIGLLSSLHVLSPYLSERRRFERANVDELCGPYTLEWQEYLPRLLSFAVEAGFLHRSERTVHEQILFRLGSRSRPVTFHDIVGGRIVTRRAGEVRAEILAAVAALRSLGVRRGDRVALVGLNCTRYLTLDTAIGLAGAVSVPLYYTSPPAEIDEVLADCGARLLFVGAPGVQARLDDLKTELPVVSFCREAPPDGHPRTVQAWEEFLALGRGGGPCVTAPVGFGDVATLRYTSGTTGSPKGVIFDHANLRWMAETMTSLLPWKVRLKRASYLSFLPLNHVVEGILAAYSPYYFPAPIDLYFLEEIRDLQRALPAVRPAVFFSVPRVYEKIWESFSRSKPGRVYLRAREGGWKRVLRSLLRRQLLRRAGLDRCAQLIVGSASPGESLLRSYRELGIELHNAYGLTEAPLISLNRLGANRLGTAGAPLPLTEVRVAGDGELMVRGPQVTAGYFGKEVVQPFRNGWLLTGDLGYLTDQGDLVLQGRKKELLITAYGKNIHPAKIEMLLREIPVIREAMVIGDGRPYCTALLWIDDEPRLGPEGPAAIDRGVAEVNTRLSGPERVKRWAVLPYDLSTGSGELTANLKLKREVVMRRYADVVEALYDPTAPAAAWHFGRAPKEA